MRFWRSCAWMCAVEAGLCAVAMGQPRPYLFSMGRFTAAWAFRPRSYDQQIWDHMVTLGVTMTGTGLAWCDAEPTQGQYNWSAIDYADFCVNEILARGMEPTFFVGLTPAWAALHPELPPHQTPPSEDYVQEFMDFHRFVADRYRGRVKYYFFWNEPNGCSWINPNCANSDSYPLYTQWLIRCSQAIKEMDPDARIIAGNLDYHSGVKYGYEYVQGMYAHGAGPYIDGIAIHSYDSSGTIHWQALADTRNVMVANGDANKGIWVNEFGWNTTDYQETADKLVQVLTELKQPQWDFVVMANYLVLNDGAGVENYGLMDADLNPRPGYYAYRDMDKTFPEHADFSADLTEGVAPLTIQFADESYVIGSHTWLWQFGDGETSADPNPSHTYTLPGMHTVRLTVTGDNGWFTAEKPDYIEVLSEPPPCGVRNPSFEDNGGSLDEWEIVKITTKGPDNPPRDNSNPYSVITPFGTHFAGKISSGTQRDFHMGQVVCVPEVVGVPTGVAWQLDVWVQLRCTDEGVNNPTGIHQVWEIGWNADGTAPADIMACDHYGLIASLDGNDTGNDYDFHPVQRNGAIGDVEDLEAVVLRVHLYNDDTWWWTLMNFDNVSLALSPLIADVPGDFDTDGDVDIRDVLVFRSCTTGPDVGPPDGQCVEADFDEDGDVDQTDFAVFQRCLSGEGTAADPHCAD